MQDFPSNSRKAKATEAPREKLRPVTSAKTRGRKGGLSHKFKQMFFTGSGRDAAEHMVTDVVVPAIRDTLYDALQTGINHLIYGDRVSRPRRRSPLMSNAPGHVNYGDISSQRHIPGSPAGPPSPRSMSRQSRARHNLDELVIPSRQEAEEVIDQMFEMLSRYGIVSVSNLYELTGVRSEHTDEKWGWTSLKGAKAVRLRQGGFLLDLPEPEPLV